ncbi:MAG: hypothetical protein K6F17_04465 [Lachnospiraceae bacterium]|nr:hypothetical protein [Lachnospiraceae bacterium]
MLKKSESIKIGLISTLVVLAILCAVVFSKKSSQYNKKHDSRILSTWDIDMTPQKKNIASWPSFVKKDDAMYIFNSGIIFKWDYKSTSYRPACDDPACDHQTDECPATFSPDKYESVTYYNDHWIFVEKDVDKRYYLGYCDFDGKNRKRVLDISDDIQGAAPLLYIDCIGEKIYVRYNSSVSVQDESGWNSAERACIIKYDVSLISSGKAYSEKVFLCDDKDNNVVHVLFIDDERFVVDVPGTGDGIEKYRDCRIYNQEDSSYITVESARDAFMLSDGRYVAQKKEGLMLVDGDKTIRLDEGGWGVSYWDDNRIYVINRFGRQIASEDKNGVIPDGEVRVYDYDGNLVDRVYLPKNYSLIDNIAAYDGRYYMTSIDFGTRSYFYAYDTQNPDKGWKKINRGY